ncbi:MAG TPA: DUF1992 domain-containing protein [Herpetosiphonaceae bacterium]|nr:DUF1992 domain-containing protein [Herpetosiphonaceae bacterium]
MSASRPNEPDHDAEHPAPAPMPRQPLNQRTYHSLVDQRIAAAHADGAFDNLPGAGRPLQFEDDSLVPEEERVGYRLLKNAGFAPPWIEMQKTIRAEQSKLESWRKHVNSRWSRLGAREQQRLQDEHQERIQELNRLILHYNLIVPPAAGQMSMLRLTEELAYLGT